jgi:GTP cyclohydrolase I
LKLKDKTDPRLGEEVRTYLIQCGVETPLTDKVDQLDGIKLDIVRTSFRNIMEALGLDLTDDSLQETPDRVAKMYVNEIFAGLKYENFPKCTAVENKMHYDEMVVEKNITCISSCEHHFVTIDQKAHIAYIPKDKVLGLSKLNRLCKYFAQRPQIQERFAEQVYHALEYILGTSDIAVVVEGRHYCVAQRGVEDSTSTTITSKLGGAFKDNATARQEFLSLVRS